MSVRHVTYDGHFRLEWLAPGETVASAADGTSACIVVATNGTYRRYEVGDEIPIHVCPARKRQATYPEDLAVVPLTIDELAEVVKGRIKTAFAPIGDIDNAEVAQKAEWVVNGIDMWGVSPS